MLKNLKIKGFKSIIDDEIDFGRINLFIGANGAGKSNVLEAIGVLSAALGRDITDAQLQQKGVRLSVPTLFKSAFKNRGLRVNFGLEAEMDNDVKYDVRITASEASQNLRFFSEHIRCGNKKYLGRSNHGISVEGMEGTQEDMSPERGLWDRYGEFLKGPRELADELNKLAKYCIYAPQTSFLRGTDVESIPIKPIGLFGGGLPQAAETVLRRLGRLSQRNEQNYHLMAEVLDLVWMPGWANKFAVNRLDPKKVSSQVKTGETTLYFRDKFMKRNRDMLSAYDSSEGSLYLLFLAVVILHPEAPKILAFDNVDNALNPSVTRVLLEKMIAVTCGKRFRQRSMGPEQVFVTSHNPTALDAFDLFKNDQRVFVVRREKETGYTKIDRLKPKKGMTRSDWIRIKKGKRLSELWIEGLIDDSLGTKDPETL